ncbi:MAG TPA: lipid-A-disaccharide synthase [Chitinophagaceae bacterium]|nr:lipid-A-disaccharide synthase [Chitinophagaceae bacterium]
MKYYIIAGEASADLHGSNLIKELRKLDSSPAIHCWGGEKMEAAGAQLIKHYRELAFMGFWEVIKNIFTIFRNLQFCKKNILDFNPDVLILIDYPGFNLRIAKWAKQYGFNVIYYISPQVWAWKENRVKLMKTCIDKMIVILPFEKKYYKEKWNWEVEYAGHPLVEVVESYRLRVTGFETQKNSVIALLPGSRKQEILKKLPVMLEAGKCFPGYQFIVAKAPGVDEDFYNKLLSPYKNVSFVSNQTYSLLMQAKAALVTSGTATLETALFGVPQVVCYKGSFFSYLIAKMLIRVKYISLVNLIMDKPVVKELIQQEMNVKNLEKELNDILQQPDKIAAMKKDYAALKELLTEKENASLKAARLIYDFLSGK